jgi:hypothetical protein
MKINLFAPPPTAAEIESAAAAARDAALALSRRRARVLSSWFALTGVVAVLIGLRFGFTTAGLAATVLLTMGMALIAAPPFDEQSPPGRDAPDHEFHPIGPDLAETVIAACRLDPKVDQYRQAVVAQQRDLTRLEGYAFKQWLECGYMLSLVRKSVSFASNSSVTL